MAAAGTADRSRAQQPQQLLRMRRGKSDRVDDAVDAAGQEGGKRRVVVAVTNDDVDLR